MITTKEVYDKLDIYSNHLKEKCDKINKLLPSPSSKIKIKNKEIKLIYLFSAVLISLVFLTILTSTLLGDSIIDSEPVSVNPQPSSYSHPASNNPPAVFNPAPQPISNPIPEPPANFEQLPATLMKSDIIKNFPSNAVVSLKFFTFIGGQRIWQNEYIIKKNSVVEGKADKPDVIMNLHSKYVNRAYSEDFCAIIKDSKKNGDLGFETLLNPVSLAWKFKSIIKYKDCI